MSRASCTYSGNKSLFVQSQSFSLRGYTGWPNDAVQLSMWLECVLSCCRYHHAAVCLSTMQSVLIYGGIVEHSVVSDELWIFSLHTGDWRRLMVRMLLIITVHFICMTLATCPALWPRPTCLKEGLIIINLHTYSLAANFCCFRCVTTSPVTIFYKLRLYIYICCMLGACNIP